MAIMSPRGHYIIAEAIDDFYDTVEWFGGKVKRSGDIHIRVLDNTMWGEINSNMLVICIDQVEYDKRGYRYWMQPLMKNGSKMYSFLNITYKDYRTNTTVSMKYKVRVRLSSLDY